MSRERTRVDSFRAGDIPFTQIFVERHFGAPVAWDIRQFLDDESAHMGRRAFLVERVDAVVSNQRICHRHDLPAIRWIGQHFLITGHRGVEANLTHACAGRAKRFALETSTVFESYKRAHFTADYLWCLRIFKFVSATHGHCIVCHVERSETSLASPESLAAN